MKKPMGFVMESVLVTGRTIEGVMEHPMGRSIRSMEHVMGYPRITHAIYPKGWPMGSLSRGISHEMSQFPIYGTVYPMGHLMERSMGHPLGNTVGHPRRQYLAGVQRAPTVVVRSLGWRSVVPQPQDASVDSAVYFCGARDGVL